MSDLKQHTFEWASQNLTLGKLEELIDSYMGQCSSAYLAGFSAARTHRRAMRRRGWRPLWIAIQIFHIYAHYFLRTIGALNQSVA